MRNKVDDLGKASVTVEDYIEGKPYDEITIVTDAVLGMTCISRRPVPAGIPLTDERFWMCITKLEASVMLNYKKVQDTVAELKQLVFSFLATAKGGTALSNNFGNSEDIGITQKALTSAFSSLYKTISDATGQKVTGIQLEITPETIASYKETDVIITASAGYGYFEDIKIYFEDEEIVHKTNIQSFTYNAKISKTTNVKIVATILGIEYTEEKTIKMYYPLYIGCGKEYQDIINEDCLREYNGSPKGSYDIDCKAGDYIFIVIPKEAALQIEQIEMNDFNVPMETRDYEDYVVYKSRNAYQEGIYSIDINY